VANDFDEGIAKILASNIAHLVDFDLEKLWVGGAFHNAQKWGQTPTTVVEGKIVFLDEDACQIVLWGEQRGR